MTAHTHYFTFDNVYYLQCSSASMRAKLLPSLANLIMGWWEERFLFSPSKPFMGHIKWYGHYIDDLLLVRVRAAVDILPFVTVNNLLKLEFSFDNHHKIINF